MSFPDPPDHPAPAPARAKRRRASASSKRVITPPFAAGGRDLWLEAFPEQAADREAAQRGYSVRSEEVWRAAELEYRAGHSAEAICAQFDLGLSTFRQRARREGWRRRDVAQDAADMDAAPLAFPPEPEAAPPTADLIDLAWRSMAQAIRRGRAYEARAWMRVVQLLRTEKHAEATMANRAAALAKAAEAEAEATARLHALHGEEGVQSYPSPARDDGDDPEDEDAEDGLNDPPVRADRMDLVAVLKAEAERGGHIPGFAKALLEVRSAISAARQPP